MVSIFDDEVEEVGSEIDAYCPKCKADTTHVIISKYEDEIRRVQCNPCGDVHAFRKPRGEAEEEPPEPIAVKKRAAKVKPTWEQVMAKSAKKPPRIYMVAERFVENEVVTHPKFGTGFVSEVIGLDKIEVTFQGEKRVLIHNRPGMSLPPAAYAHPVDATVAEPGQAARSDNKKKPAKPASIDKSRANGKAPETPPLPAIKAAEPARAAGDKGKGKPVPTPAAKAATLRPHGKTAAPARAEVAVHKAPVAAAGKKPAATKAAAARPEVAKAAPAARAGKPTRPEVKKATADKPAAAARPAAKHPVKPGTKATAKAAAARKPAPAARPARPVAKAAAKAAIKSMAKAPATKAKAAKSVRPATRKAKVPARPAKPAAKGKGPSKPSAKAGKASKRR